MSWNGSGTFNRLFSWVADKTAGFDISSSRMDSDSNDIASNGFGNCLTRDGQGQPTATLPMAGFRHTGVGNGVARSDYAAMGQVEDGLLNWTAAGGGADAITATYTPALTSLSDGQLCFFRATAANATTTPTFAPNSLTAHTITKEGGTALVAGDIPGNLAEVVLRYNSANTRWELLNPASDVEPTIPTTGWGLTTTSSVFSVATTNPPFGFNAPINLQLNATVGSNLLTIAVKGNNGSDPSATNPVLIPFRDSTIGNGDPVWVAVTSALSISTNATGATLGTASSNVPFRIWVLAFNNAGTAVLALFQSVTGGASPTAITGLNEAQLVSTTAISAAATSAGVFYTPNGTTLSNKTYRIIGYVDYGSGLATAGTYASAPTTVQLFGPGVKKPSDLVQYVYFTETNAEGGFGSSTYTASAHAQMSISPTSTPNILRVSSSGAIGNNTDGDPTFCRLSRGTINNSGLFGNESVANPGAANGGCGFNIFGLDAPGTTSSTTYAVQARATTGAAILCAGTSVLAMEAMELMV